MTGDSKHTGGDWVADHNKIKVGKFEYRPHWNGTADNNEMVANAKLMAASKVMLEALGAIRATSSAIEAGEEPWIEGVQEITRIALTGIQGVEPGETK